MTVRGPARSTLTAVVFVAWLVVVALAGRGDDGMHASLLVLLTLAAAAAAVGTVVRDRRLSLASVGVSAAAFVVFMYRASAVPNSRGDQWFWGGLRWWVPRSRVWLSSSLPMSLLQVVSPRRFDQLTPLFGLIVLAGGACLGVVVARRLGSDHSLTAQMAGGMFVVLISGAPFLYVRNYTEMYPMAGAAAMASVVLLAAMPAAVTARWAAATGAVAALAACCHGQYLGLVAAAAAIVAWRSRSVRTTAIAVAASVLTTVGVLAVMRLAGADLTRGNSLGSSGGPLTFTRVTGRHLGETKLILTVALGATVPFVVVGARRLRTTYRDAAALMAVGPVLFWLLWKFDFGLPQDLDLAVSAVWGMLPLAVLGVRATATRRWFLPVALAASLVMGVVVTSRLIPADQYPAHPEVLVPGNGP